jgi:4a-hydroxytetrahydrobiopterin dehydratase
LFAIANHLREFKALKHLLPQRFAMAITARQFGDVGTSHYDESEDHNMAKLSADEIAQKLKALPGWEYKDNAIVKLFRFKEFLHGIEFVQKVAEIAEAADHHPDILINYTRVTFTCSTHDAGGVTDKDFKLADNIEIAFKDRDG